MLHDLVDDISVYSDKDMLQKAITINEKQKQQRLQDFYNSKLYVEASGKISTFEYEKYFTVKYAEILNYVNSFLKVMQDEQRTLLFLTSTLKPDCRIKDDSNILLSIKDQHKIFNGFFDYLRQSNAIRDFKYIKAFEFHKSLDLHSHTGYFLPDNALFIVKFIEFLLRGKTKFDLGRFDLILDVKYKDALIQKFSLIPYYDRKRDRTLYYRSSDDFSKGDILFISFFNDQEDVTSQITKYIIKYINKSRRYDKKIDIYTGIFKYLGIRPFIASKSVLPPVTAYRKVRGELVAYDERYKDLYELQKDIKNGEIFFNVEYEEVKSKAFALSEKRKILADKHNAYDAISFEEISYNPDGKCTKKEASLIIGSSKYDISMTFEDDEKVEYFSPYIPSEQFCDLKLLNIDYKGLMFHYTPSSCDLNNDPFQFELYDDKKETYRRIKSVTVTDWGGDIIASWNYGQSEIKNVWDFDFQL